jgi:3-oxoadipate CoA-transferase alpha subunit
MIDKRVSSLAEAVRDIRDGATLLTGGFGGAGIPNNLFQALLESGVRDLTVVSNNAGSGSIGLAALIEAGRVRKIICSFPRVGGAHAVENAWRAGRIELEIVPQGTLSERMRAAGAGIGGFYTRTSAGTRLSEGKETRMIDGVLHVFEPPLGGDVALVKAWRADRWGNLVYRMSARNLNPVIATAAKLTIAEVDEYVELGGLDPEHVVTPGIFVDRLVVTPVLRY